jgi:hypothetical protein
MIFRFIIVVVCAGIYVATWLFVMVYLPSQRHGTTLRQPHIALAVKSRQALRSTLTNAQRSALDRDLLRASDPARVRRLLQQGADPNAFGAHSLRHGYSALHNAARKGHLAVAKLLLNAGANTYAFDNPLCPVPFVPVTEGTPLAYALRHQRTEVAALLQSARQGTFSDAELDAELDAVEPSVDVEAADTHPTAADTQASSKCAVCLDGPLENIVLPCGHLCLCSTCAIRVAETRPSRCPICRQAIASVTKVYY